LGRAISVEDLPSDGLQARLIDFGLPDHVAQHISTMAQLHREDRYNRATGDVERVTGRPAQTVEQWVSAHLDLFS
jgi:hypothetical protein